MFDHQSSQSRDRDEMSATELALLREQLEKDVQAYADSQEFRSYVVWDSIGLSWGGVNSLAVVYPDLDRPNQDFGGRIVRLNIGLENTDDLIADLARALPAL